MFELTPLTAARGISNYFDSMEKTLLSAFDQGGFSCSTDIIDRGGEYVLKAELPGFKKEDIEINTDGRRLVISASHKNESEQKDESYIRRERSYGSFSRSFDVSGIKTGDITASYNNGVLEVILPKEDAPKDICKKIDIH